MHVAAIVACSRQALRVLVGHDGAEGVEDGEETTDAVWITPIKALEEHQAGRFDLMSVTVKQLSAITGYKDLEALKMALSHQDTFPHYQPPDYLPS